jgi:hypothetical protein
VPAPIRPADARRPSAVVMLACAAGACAMAFLVTPAAPAAERWIAPVDGAVVRAFAFGRDPYAAGQHRGVDLAARATEPVRAPCSGRVRFAGPVPGHRRGVTIACGRYAATVLELAAVRVHRGAVVVRGAVVGVAGAGGLHLGARRLGERHGYVDPLGLLDRRPPLGHAPPAGRRPGIRGPVPAPEPTAAPRPLPRPVPVPDAGPRRVPGALPVPDAGPRRARRGRPLAAPDRGREPIPAQRPVAGAPATPAPVPAHGAGAVAWLGAGLVAMAVGGVVRARRRRTAPRAAAASRVPSHAA